FSIPLQKDSQFWKLISEEELKMSSPLQWMEEAETAFCKSHQALPWHCQTIARSLSKLEDCKGHFMTSVLVQQHGAKMKPVAYLSSKLDNVACARAVIAASLAVEARATIVLFRSLTLKMPNVVSDLLL
uniref:Reverse transcriptase/retrotransposon-derived protein RNase H-like domain-containing protein n=1 Tax=Oryzias latipes TaxID=8090 RepID=A0A3B3I303_ORYLA